MNPNPQSQKYLRTKVLTATAEQLQLMLFDGAIRFSEQARAALQNQNYEQSYLLLTKASAIVNQLICALRADVLPDLCKKLKGLYAYAYRKLVDANLNHHVESLDEAIGILKYQRETWVMLLDQVTKTRAAAAASQIQVPGPDPRMEARISMQG
ncbi:MAG: flagellar export chaperone FliS [Tepidisphaeraceae bacterium]|jgi:flagellar protein FliS